MMVAARRALLSSDNSYCAEAIAVPQRLRRRPYVKCSGKCLSFRISIFLYFLMDGIGLF